MKGWLWCAVSHGVPSELVTFGIPKNRCALTGQPRCTVPLGLSTSNCVLTPWRTNCGDAATAMSGGLQPCPKYEHVVADDCCPIKLSAGLGVPVVGEPEVELPPLTPPVAPTSDAGPLPFAQRVASWPSSVDAVGLAPLAPRLVGETT